jgi:PmbA protein
MAERVADVKTGEMDVIFTPEVMPTLIQAFTLGANGKTVQKGNSPLGGRIGEKILDERISILDDATIPAGVNTQPIDDEGIPVRKKHIFSKGVLENYLLDLEHAQLLGMESTGNGMRGYSSCPSPGATNIYIQPGDKSLEQMIKEVKEGLIVYGMIGGGQSNILAGDFSVNLSPGFYIKNGEIQGRVKDVMLAGNVYNIMKNVKDISNVVEECFGIYSPAFAFADMKIAAKS